MPNRLQQILYLTAFLFCALSLGPALAHLLELPNKIGLSREDYFIVQGIYRGWALLGIVVYGAIASTLALTISLRGEGAAMGWAAAAFVALVAAHVLFWIFTYPANVATVNWTQPPADWANLRIQWEYSHAMGAVLNLIAVMSLAMSVLTWGQHRRSEPLRSS